MSGYNPAEKALLRARVASEQGEWGECLKGADDCLRHNPASAEAYFMAGRAAMAMDLDGLATQFFHMGSKIAPDIPAMWNNLGASLVSRDAEGAYKALRRAHALDPSLTAALSSLCGVTHGLGRWAEALEWGERCMAIAPDMPDVIYNTSLSLLALGRWEEAWPRYKGSLEASKRLVRNYHGSQETPRWSPAVKGGKVVIYGEQGIGDEIMFATMLPAALAAAAAQGTKVILETDTRLADLFRRSFPGVTVYATRANNVCEWVLDERPTHKIEIGGLGEYFAPKPIWSDGYLTADPAKAAMARAWLDTAAPSGKPRIGVAWTAGTWETGRRERTLPLSVLGPIFALDAEFVCLEYEDAAEDLRAIADEYGVRLHYPRSLVAKGADYDDTAALVSCLDMVIAPTTSVVDLCGALGKRVNVLVPFAPPWRYSEQAGEDAMFWYRSATTFRQREKGAWARPVMQAAASLRAQLELAA